MTPTLAADNFLLPNGTFFFNLLAFAVVLFVLWRYVVPPVRKAMDERREVIQRQIDASREAEERLKAADAKYREALAGARTEAAKIREAARLDADRIAVELRERAEQEVARIHQRGEEQLAHQRTQIVAELRGELGRLAVDLADRIVGESLEDEARRRGTIDRFLDELDAVSAPAGK